MPLFDLRKDLSSIKENIGKPFTGITSGITVLDEFILGFGKGEMSVSAGRPEIGKSSMARDILLNIGQPPANAGVSLLCTLEMPCEEITELLAANLGKVDYQSIKRGDATERVLEKFHIALEQLSQYSIIINDDSYVVPDSIMEILKGIIKDEPLACLIVDYLQLMSLRKAVPHLQQL